MDVDVALLASVVERSLGAEALTLAEWSAPSRIRPDASRAPLADRKRRAANQPSSRYIGTIGQFLPALAVRMRSRGNVKPLAPRGCYPPARACGYPPLGGSSSVPPSYLS
jgi:hypothetical protein